MPSTDSNPYESPANPHESTSNPPAGIWPWLAVISAAIAMAATLPGRTHALGLITTRLLDDFPALSESDYSLINLLATLIGSLFCFPAGWLLDRFGPRRVTPFLVLAVSALALALSLAQDPLTLAIVITLVRGVAQSMLSVASLTIIGRAFPKRPGSAMGAYAVILTIFMAVGTGLLMWRVTQDSWRVAWSYQCLPLVVAAVMIWLLTPRRFVSVESKQVVDTKSNVSSATWRQALVSPCFWTFAIASSLFNLVYSGVSLFQQSIFAKQGIPEGIYHQTMLIGLVLGLVANVFGGWLANRMNMGRLLFIAMTFLAFSLAALPWASQPWHAYVFALAYTIAGGFITVLFFSIWGHAFGQAELGRIQGMAQMATVVGSALGPVVITESNRLTGSYHGALYVSAGLSALLAAAAFIVRVPNANAGDWKQGAVEPTLTLKENLA